MKNYFMLRSRKIAADDHRKYGSNLIVILPENYLKDMKNFVSPFDLYLHSHEIDINDLHNKTTDTIAKMGFYIDGNIELMFEGEFRISKKGTNIWDFTGKKSHILFWIDWGGSFRNSRGNSSPEEITDKFLYYHRAHSNGGGKGYTYIIVPNNFKYEIDINNL